jgi:hypothetical protein
VRQLDDRPGVAVTGRDVDALGRRRVRVRAAVVQAERDRSDAREVGGREPPVARCEPRREVDEVEAIEVDGTERSAHGAEGTPRAD